MSTFTVLTSKALPCGLRFLEGGGGGGVIILHVPFGLLHKYLMHLTSNTPNKMDCGCDVTQNDDVDDVRDTPRPANLACAVGVGVDVFDVGGGLCPRFCPRDQRTARVPVI